MKTPAKNYAFIDGSFNPKTNVYGCGGFLIDQNGGTHIIQARDNNPKIAKMRNVAGEILGATKAITLAIDLGMDELTIFHDYEGIAAWPQGRWKCKKRATREYTIFVREALRRGLMIMFSHVKSHSGNLDNARADRLAKIAVGLEVD